MLSSVEEIKSKLDIVEFIAGYIKLEKSGSNFRAVCPFHKEKTPSFFVTPSRQIWHCFGGCNEGGDIFKFLMKLDGLDFPQALRILAERAGVTLQNENIVQKSERDRIYAIHDAAVKFYSNVRRETPAVDAYLKDRGLTSETINEFHIGYAPDDWRVLFTHLKNEGFKEQEIEKAGLIVKKQDSKVSHNNYYDRFRNRVMFPLADLQGKVVGFSGRVFGAYTNPEIQGGKYVNSPETPVYQKSLMLYGLDRAKAHIKEAGQCVVVEGQMDLIMSYQAGVRNVVATSGTALTQGHLKILKRYTEHLVFAFDADSAGVAATKKGVDLALGEGFTVHAIVLDQKDPADLVKEGGNKAWEEKVKTAIPIIDYYFATAFKRFPVISLEAKKTIARELLPEIRKITNKVEQDHYLNELSAKLMVHYAMLQEEMGRTGGGTPAGLPARNIEQPKTSLPAVRGRKEILYDRTIALILANPKLFSLVEQEEDLFLTHADARYNMLYETMKPLDKDNFLFDNLKTIISRDASDHINRLMVLGEILAGELESMDGELQLCLRELRMQFIRQDLERLTLEVRRCEANKMPVEALMKEINSLNAVLGRMMQEKPRSPSINPVIN